MTTSAPSATWTTTPTWATGSTYQKPTEGRRRSYPYAPQQPAARFAAITAIPVTRLMATISGRDGESHYAGLPAQLAGRLTRQPTHVIGLVATRQFLHLRPHARGL